MSPLSLSATRPFECTRDCSSHDALHAALDDSWLAREFASLWWQERFRLANELSVTSESSRSIGQCHVRRVALRYGGRMRMLSEMIVPEERTCETERPIRPSPLVPFLHCTN